MKKYDYQTSPEDSVILNIPERYYNNTLLNRLLDRSYEADELSLIENIDKDDNVLELGSCLGYLSVLVSKQCKNIISIEANPELKDALEKTKIENGCENLKFINAIVDKDVEFKEFYTYDLIVAGSADRDDKDDPDLSGVWNKNIKKYKVKTETIETIELNNDINFNTLLIDIEGGEMVFFNQHKDYIERNIKKIIVELHGRIMNDYDFDKDCLNILKEIGFTINKITNGSFYLTRDTRG